MLAALKKNIGHDTSSLKKYSNCSNIINTENKTNNGDNINLAGLKLRAEPTFLNKMAKENK